MENEIKVVDCKDGTRITRIETGFIPNSPPNTSSH